MTAECSHTIYERIAAHRQEILSIAARHGARQVRVFGSIARREANEQSDVDFLVTMDRGRTLFDVGGLLMDLQELLGCSIDIVTEGGLQGRLRDTVLQEAIPLEEIAA